MFFEIFWLVIYLNFHWNFTHKGLSDAGHSPTHPQKNSKSASFSSFGFWGSLFFSLAYFDAFFSLRMIGLWILKLYCFVVDLCWISMVLCFLWDFYLLFNSVICRFAGYFWCFIGTNKFMSHQFVELIVSRTKLFMENCWFWRFGVGNQS